MPELPEVETTRRYIEPLLVGRRITRVKTTADSYFFLTKPEKLRRVLRGRAVEALERQGKYLLAMLDDESRLLLHLGMTGQLFGAGAQSVRLLSKTARSALKPEEQARFQPDAHTHLSLSFEDGGAEVYFRDVRKFGKVLHLPKGASDARLDKLGPDALEADAASLWPQLRRRKSPIKTVLLDQSLLAGVGNIYADEALARARVRPTRTAQRVKKRELELIIAALKQVLERSIETGGTSISDYLRPDGEDGGFQDERWVYGREGEGCPQCGAAITRVVLGQRSSHYCPRCQK